MAIVSPMQFAISLLLVLVLLPICAWAQDVVKPSDARNIREQRLREAIQSIRSILRDEVDKIDEAQVKTWYLDLPSWPAAYRDFLILEFPMDELTVPGQVSDLHYWLKGQRNVMRCRVPQRFQLDPKWGAAGVLDGRTKIEIPIDQLTSVDEFTIEVELRILNGTGVDRILSYSDVQGASVSRGWELSIEQGRICFSFANRPGSLLRVCSMEKLPANQWAKIGVGYAGAGAAEDVRLSLNHKSCEIAVESDRLEGEVVHDKSKGILRFGHTDSDDKDMIFMRSLKMYGTALTQIEFAESAPESRFVTWEELTTVQKGHWREHYSRRVDPQCKYHIESLRHYYQTLSRLRDEAK